MKPPRSILDKNFRYVPSHNTDVKKTIERVKAEQAEKKKQEKVLNRIISLRSR